MHALMTRVLEQRQLNAAGQLFTISDYDVITDLHTAFSRIKEIFNAPHYIDRRVDQSIVEIVIARITTAIRETGCIETYSAELVDILDSCLNHEMSVVDSEGEYIDSPHCKIASDLLSSLFLHYGKRSVMTLTLPVAMKAVGSSNQELVRNTTSYISLAAIHNGRTLAQYSVQIISHIINGNYSLLRVLPQIYQDNKEPFHAHISQLLAVLEAKDVDCSERLSLLQLASMMANSKPDLLIPYLSQFDKYVLSPSTCTAVLNIYMSLVSQGRAHCLAPFLSILKQASQRPAFSSNQATILKIIGNIGRVSLPLASEAVDELIRSTEHADAQLLSSILIEIEGVGEAWPSSLRSHINALRAIACPSNTRVVDRIVTLAGNSSTQLMNGDVTLISIQNGEKNSCDSLLSKDYARVNGDVNIISSGARTLFPACDSPTDSCALELDRNTHHLAMQYQNRSSGSLPRHYSRSRASVAHSLQGQRTTSENVTISGSRDLSLSSVAPSVAGSLRAPHDYVTRPPPVYNPPKTQTLPAGFAPNTQIQIGKDGRVRPYVGGRRPAQWPVGSYETTFPANAGPVTTTKMNPLCEEDERQWTSSVDRSDVVLQFVEHRKNKIRRFISEVTARFPIPMQCTVEGSKNSKHRMIIHFSCQARGMYCVFSNEYFFAFKTKFPSTWLHLMFLQMQSSSIESSGEVISQSAQPFLTLAHCWQCLPPAITRNKEFVTLVTSAFPTTKEQYKMLKELEEASFFDCFSLDGPLNRWSCFSCTHPDKVRSFVEDGSTQKVLEGQLKEKKGRWRFLRRWQTKYFTLSSAALTYSTQHMNSESNVLLPAIDLKTIRSVRSLSRGRKSRKSLRKAFEIFTSDNSSVVLKATDEKKAEEWLQCLQIAVAHAKREGN